MPFPCSTHGLARTVSVSYTNTPNFLHVIQFKSEYYNPGCCCALIRWGSHIITKTWNVFLGRTDQTFERKFVLCEGSSWTLNWTYKHRGAHTAVITKELWSQLSPERNLFLKKIPQCQKRNFVSILPTFQQAYLLSLLSNALTGKDKPEFLLHNSRSLW